MKIYFSWRRLPSVLYWSCWPDKIIQLWPCKWSSTIKPRLQCMYKSWKEFLRYTIHSLFRPKYIIYYNKLILIQYIWNIHYFIIFCYTGNNKSHAFSLSGLTNGPTPVTSMVGGIGPSSCINDWVIIPCAMNVGRLPTSPPACVDRIRGRTFKSEVSTTEATVYSNFTYFSLNVHFFLA